MLKENVKNSNWGEISRTPGHSACLKRMSRPVTGVRYLGHLVIVHANCLKRMSGTVTGVIYLGHRVIVHA